MSIHGETRGYAHLLRTSTTSDRDAEAVIMGSAGEPSSGTLPTGQTLATGQVAVAVNADAVVPGDVLYVTPDGGTTYYPVEVGTPSTRVALSWTAGARGKPGINGDIQNAAEATRMIADPDFEIQGTNSTSALSTFNAEGGLTLTTAGADGDEMILVPHQDANQSAWGTWTWGTDKELIWEATIATGANITNAIVWAGLKLTSTEVTATDDDQVFFRYEDDVNTGKWQAISSIGGTDDAADSGVTVAVSTTYVLRIVVASDRTARMYINGTLVETTGALTDATDLIPFIGVAADGAAAAKAITVYGQRISRTAG